MAKPLFAILLDGGFLTKKLLQKLHREPTATDVVDECLRLRSIAEVADYELLRIYYYDAQPATGSVRYPVSGGNLDLGATPRFVWAQALYDQLVLKPNLALRMGYVRLAKNRWRMKPHIARQLITMPRALVDADFDLDVTQKGVDMRIGLDMARLALRDMVRAIVVVTGDSDFVPAFKFVRREGVKVIPDPMGHNVRVELKQHADIVLQVSRP